jgi:hypothetical protein
MRCVIVNGARPKAETKCAHCGNTIGEGYIREIRSRSLYCDFACYSVAIEPSLHTFGFRSSMLRSRGS